MQTQAQILYYSVLAIIFSALLAWFANEYVSKTVVTETNHDWSDSRLDQSDFEWFATNWQIEPLESSTDERFRFWLLSSFEASYLVEIQSDDAALERVTIKLMKYRDLLKGGGTNRQFFTGYVSNIESAELDQLLIDTRFWATPPGDLEWSCIKSDDGFSYVVETNFGQQYRLWSNACEPSPEMQRIASFFERLANRVMWPSSV